MSSVGPSGRQLLGGGKGFPSLSTSGTLLPSSRIVARFRYVACLPRGGVEWVAPSFRFTSVDDVGMCSDWSGITNALGTARHHCIAPATACIVPVARACRVTAPGGGGRPPRGMQAASDVRTTPCCLRAARRGGLGGRAVAGEGRRDLSPVQPPRRALAAAAGAGSAGLRTASCRCFTWRASRMPDSARPPCRAAGGACHCLMLRGTFVAKHPMGLLSRIIVICSAVPMGKDRSLGSTTGSKG